jgi:hypothetical protein
VDGKEGWIVEFPIVSVTWAVVVCAKNCSGYGTVPKVAGISKFNRYIFYRTKHLLVVTFSGYYYYAWIA